MCFFVLKKYVLFPKKHVEFSRKFNPNLGSGATFSAAMEGWILMIWYDIYIYDIYIYSHQKENGQVYVNP